MALDNGYVEFCVFCVDSGIYYLPGVCSDMVRSPIERIIEEGQVKPLGEDMWKFFTVALNTLEIFIIFPMMIVMAFLFFVIAMLTGNLDVILGACS